MKENNNAKERWNDGKRILFTFAPSFLRVIIYKTQIYSKGCFALLPLLFLIFILLLSSCALPVPIGSELNGFVPPREIQVVSLAREGMQLFNNSRFYEAEARFRKALYLDPSLNNVRFNLATTLERIGLFDEAKKIYKDLLRIEGEKAVYHAALGRLLLSQSDYNAAMKEFNSALLLAERDDDQPTVTSLSQSIVTLDFTVGQFDDAICEAKSLLLRTKSADSLRQYLKLLASDGKSADALEFLETKGSEYAPDDSIANLYLRCMLLFDVGKQDDALELSERVLATAGLDATIDFDLHVITLVMKYESAEPGLWEKDESISFLKILNESMKANALSSLYWSPKLLGEVHKMLKDPVVVEVLG